MNGKILPWWCPPAISSKMKSSPEWKASIFRSIGTPFVVSHLLVRTALSRYSELLPKSWRFIYNDHGKPRLDPDLGAAPLCFSLSHTKGISVVGVTREQGDRRRCGAGGAFRKSGGAEQAFFLPGGERRAGKTAARPPAGAIFPLLDVEGGLYQGAGPRPLPSPRLLLFSPDG